MRIFNTFKEEVYEKKKSLEENINKDHAKKKCILVASLISLIVVNFPIRIVNEERKEKKL